MRTTIPEKLLALADDIAAHGHANLTRLMVLKKWFAKPARLSAFARWVAAQALAQKGKMSGAAGALRKDGWALLDRVQPGASHWDRDAAERLHARLRDFQDEVRSVAWGQVRVIHHWNLLLLEQALAILLWHADSPMHGYKLAADFFLRLPLRQRVERPESDEDQGTGPLPERV